MKKQICQKIVQKGNTVKKSLMNTNFSKIMKINANFIKKLKKKPHIFTGQWIQKKITYFHIFLN